MNPNALHSLSTLIERACLSGRASLAESTTSELKTLCRRSDACVEHAYRLLARQLDEKHCECRLSAFQLCCVLFDRSHRFRTLVVDDIQHFVSRTAGLDSDDALPAPKKVAERLQTEAIAKLSDWTLRFGAGYPALHIAARYVESKRKSTTAADAHQTAASRRAAAAAIRRAENAKLHLDETRQEIRDCSAELTSAVALLVPTLDDFHVGTSSTVDSAVNDSSHPDQLHGLAASSSGVSFQIQPSAFKVDVNSDNEEIVATVRSRLWQIEGSFLPALERWLVALRHHTDGYHEELGECMETKETLSKLCDKVKLLGITSAKRRRQSDDEASDSEDEDDGDFIDVPITDDVESEKTHLPQPVQRRFKPDSVSSSSVPVVDFGLDLAYWGNEASLKAPEQLQMESFWKNSSGASGEKSEEDASMRQRVITFAGKWEPVEHTCRARLPTGKLCERQDRVKCPFHGTIIERDDMGEPINASAAAAAEKTSGYASRIRRQQKEPWKDEALMRQLEASTGQQLIFNRKSNRHGKYAKLTDIRKREPDPVHSRLEKKLFERSTVKRIGRALDSDQQARAAEKFQHNFSYTHSTNVS